MRYLVQPTPEIATLLLPSLLHLHLGHDGAIETIHNAQLVVRLVRQLERVYGERVYMIVLAAHLSHEMQQCLLEVEVAQWSTAESLIYLTQLGRVDLGLASLLDDAEVELAPLLQGHTVIGLLRLLPADRMRDLQRRH